jgi:hypothetical protein
MQLSFAGLEREESSLEYENCTRAAGFTLSGLITAQQVLGNLMLDIVT